MKLQLCRVPANEHVESSCVSHSTLKYKSILVYKKKHTFDIPCTLSLKIISNIRTEVTKIRRSCSITVN